MLGTVCHYDAVCKFGFIEIPGQERTIFFHNSRQRSFYCGLDAEIYDDGGWNDEPKKGDRVIVYAIQTVAKGPRATYWAKAETKQQAEELLALIPTYRLQHRSGREAVSRLDPKPTYETAWEGKDLVDLSNYCDKHGVRIERDEFNYFYFEVLNLELKTEILNVNDVETEVKTTVSTWERCGDPRPR
jgi:hypothetical protein